ncbi:MAG: methyltransferase domain-containing protein [Candidatus Paceibacterota bacterium]
MDIKITDRTIPKDFLRYTPRRDSYLLKLCAGKKVLHIGASDWPYTKEQMERGNLLYARIGEIAAEQLGIDLDKEATEFLNNQNIPNSKVVVGDMNEMQSLAFSPDVIIFGETLEHLMNLEIALSNVKQVMRADTELIISVPNAFHFLNFVYALFRKEHQHPDHSVTFTYKTLTQLLGKNNLNVTDFRFTFLDSSRLEFLNWKGKIMYGIERLMVRISPLFAETLLVSVKKK